MIIKRVATNHISLKGLLPGYRKLLTNCEIDNSTGRFINGANANFTANVNSVKKRNGIPNRLSLSITTFL